MSLAAQYNLTTRFLYNRRTKEGNCRSYILYMINGITILKQKIPFDINYENGWQHTTDIKDIFIKWKYISNTQKA